MDTETLQTKSPRLLMPTAAFVIIVAGMTAAKSLVVPFLLAAFIAIICAQPLFWLRSKGIPTWLALLFIVLFIACLGLLFGAVIGDSITSFTDNLPYYQTRIELLMESIQGWLQKFGVKIPADTLSSYLDVNAIMKVAAGMLTGFGSMLTDGFLLIVTVIFILLEAISFPAKLRAAFTDPTSRLRHFKNYVRKINRYMAIKTITSLATGIVVTIWLAILGVDFALLWGLMAFLLNYVPNIGSFIAAIPAIILALIQLGFGKCLLVAGGYLAVNNLIGTVIEPRFMGRGLGLSTLVVFISLVFWGWALGPIGMFLSVPLTMMIMLALESNENTKWLAILLGSDVESESEPEKSQ